MKTSPEFIYTICLPDPREAKEKLDHARMVFLNLLDYVAENHPGQLDADFAVSLERAVNHVWIAYDLPQS